MKILLCGGESPLGKSLVYRLEQLPFPFIQLAADALAAITTAELESLLREKQIGAIVNVQHLPFSGGHFSERADVLACQYLRNPEMLALAAVATGCFLLQLSDCQVFPGNRRQLTVRPMCRMPRRPTEPCVWPANRRSSTNARVT
jgi:dTDP-4-dehydrorhamnose reductase